MAIAPGDYSPDFIADARALLLTGSHVTTSHSAANLQHAARVAKEAGTRVIFDIDYRPVFWKLVARDLGESRYIDSTVATTAVQNVLPLADLIVGTEEEIQIAGGERDVIRALERIRHLSSAPIIMKLGPRGCVVFTDAIPASIEDGLLISGFPVEVFNVVGAGDGFLSGFLSAWLRDEDWMACGRRGNACGALVVSRHGCSPASPTSEELDWYLENASEEVALHVNREVERVHRATTRMPRPPTALILDCSSLESGLPEADRCVSTDIAVDVVRSLAAQGRPAGIALDGSGSDAALFALGSTTSWLIRDISVPRQPKLRFLGDRTAAIILRHWPQHQIVRCTVPLGEAVLRDERLRELQYAVEMWGHELILALPEGADIASVLELAIKLRSLGIEPDWWQLPHAPAASELERTARAIEEINVWCRGFLVPTNAARPALPTVLGRLACIELIPISAVEASIPNARSSASDKDARATAIGDAVNRHLQSRQRAVTS